MHSVPFGGLSGLQQLRLLLTGFGCPINARGGAAISFLHEALGLDGAELRNPVHGPPRRCHQRWSAGAGRLVLDLDGHEHTVRADIVVLALSAIETARLLLLSANDKHPHGLG